MSTPPLEIPSLDLDNLYVCEVYFKDAPHELKLGPLVDHISVFCARFCERIFLSNKKAEQF